MGTDSQVPQPSLALVYGLLVACLRLCVRRLFGAHVAALLPVYADRSLHEMKMRFRSCSRCLCCPVCLDGGGLACRRQLELRHRESGVGPKRGIAQRGISASNNTTSVRCGRNSTSRFGGLRNHDAAVCRGLVRASPKLFSPTSDRGWVARTTTTTAPSGISSVDNRTVAEEVA